MSKLSHIDKNGKAKMVDVSEKDVTLRTATASAVVHVTQNLFSQIENNEIKKGDVLAVAKIAGIMAAKKTSEIIPLCHNIFLSDIDLTFTLNKKDFHVIIESYVKTNSKTGVEMEALTAVSVAALTIYDMCKAADKSIFISDVKLISKTGGKSGDYKRNINE